MLLRDAQTANVQKLVNSLYSQVLNSRLLIQLSPLICSITDSHYFALILFPGENVPEPLYISNNPEDFNSIYQDVQSMDFMLHRLIEKAQPVQFSDISRESIPYKEDFLIDLNRSRPVSDCMYIPVLLQGRTSGLIGIAREGNNIYNENDVKIIKFVSSFIVEALSKSLAAPELDEREVILDRDGNVLHTDDSSREILTRLFGTQWETPLWGETKHSRDFKIFWDRFNSPIQSPGDSIFNIDLEGKNYRFEIKYEYNKFFQPVLNDAPYIKLSIKDGHNQFILHKKSHYIFTVREQEVIDCIYKGFSNTDIAMALQISVSTVKKHVWNIYNKVGVDNRTGLIFALSH